MTVQSCAQRPRPPGACAAHTRHQGAHRAKASKGPAAGHTQHCPRPHPPIPRASPSGTSPCRRGSSSRSRCRRRRGSARGCKERSPSCPAACLRNCLPYHGASCLFTRTRVLQCTSSQTASVELEGAGPPEAPRTGPHGGRATTAILICDALCAAEVFGEEVQFVHCRLVGQLVQALLGGAGRLGGGAGPGSEPPRSPHSSGPWAGTSGTDGALARPVLEPDYDSGVPGPRLGLLALDRGQGQSWMRTVTQTRI